MTGFVFKIQANMDPNHRDRIAFARLCSGKLTPRHEGEAGAHRQADHAVNAPQFFFAQDRALADEAYAGDIVGIPNHGTLRIGDTLTEGEDIKLHRRAELRAGNPAPRAARRPDEGEEAEARRCSRLAEEGVVQVFRPLDGAPALVGVVGAAAARRAARCGSTAEYGLEIGFETPEFAAGALDFAATTPRRSTSSSQANYSSVADDLDGDRVFMARNQFILDYTARARAGHRLHRHQGREEGGVTSLVTSP